MIRYVEARWMERRYSNASGVGSVVRPAELKVMCVALMVRAHAIDSPCL